MYQQKVFHFNWSNNDSAGNILIVDCSAETAMNKAVAVATKMRLGEIHFSEETSVSEPIVVTTEQRSVYWD